MNETRTASGVTRLASDGVEVEVLPGVGARLHRLRVDGHDLLRTPADIGRHAEDPFFWGAFVMAPWCNRLTAQPVEFAGRSVNLRSNFRDGTAIHGQVYDRPWHVDAEDRYSIEAGGDDWPWRYRAEMQLSVGEPGLTIRQSMVNLDGEAMPAGLGIHPWFRTPVQVAIHADEVMPTNARSVPAEPVSGRFDVRRLAEMPVGLDAAWTDARWRGGVQGAAELRWPDIGLQASISMHAYQVYAVAASPRDVDAVALESQTHAAFGLQRLISGEPGGLRPLPAGERLELTTQVTFLRGPTEVR